MFKFYFLSSASVADAHLTDWADLRDYLSFYEDEPFAEIAEARLTLDEIEAGGALYEVVVLDGKPIGTCRKPASGALLAVLLPRRVAALAA